MKKVVGNEKLAGFWAIILSLGLPFHGAHCLGSGLFSVREKCNPALGGRLHWVVNGAAADI